MNKNDINAIKLFTRYHILNDNTSKLTFLNELFCEIDESNILEVREFLERVALREAGNFQVKTRIKTMISEISNIRPEKENGIDQKKEALRLIKVELEQTDKTDIMMNRELLDYFREKKFDHFFTEVPFLNYTREDFRNTLKKICSSNPIAGYVLSDDKDLELIYSQEKSIDTTVLNLPNAFKYQKEQNNFFPGLLISSAPSSLYILLLADDQGLRLVTRPQMNKNEFFTIFFPYRLLALKENKEDKSKYLNINDGNRILVLNMLSEDDYSRICDIVSNYHFINDSEEIFLESIRYINTCFENNILFKKDVDIYYKEITNIKKKILSTYKREEDREKRLRSELRYIELEIVEKYRDRVKLVICSLNIKDNIRERQKKELTVQNISEKVSTVIKRHTAILTKKDSNIITCILDDANSCYRFSQSIKEEMEELSKDTGKCIDSISICLELEVLKRKDKIFSYILDDYIEIIERLEDNSIYLDSNIAEGLSDKSSLVLLHDKRFEPLQKDSKIKFYKKI